MQETTAVCASSKFPVSILNELCNTKNGASADTVKQMLHHMQKSTTPNRTMKNQASKRTPLAEIQPTDVSRKKSNTSSHSSIVTSAISTSLIKKRKTPDATQHDVYDFGDSPSAKMFRSAMSSTPILPSAAKQRGFLRPSSAQNHQMIHQTQTCIEDYSTPPPYGDEDESDHGTFFSI
jgi:hypothetical protein